MKRLAHLRLCTSFAARRMSSRESFAAARFNFVANFHSGHAHKEPPHYAYRGDGLPDVKCAEIQNLVHMNQRIVEQGKMAPLRKPKEWPGESETSAEANSADLYASLQTLHNRILAAEWHDSSLLLLNADIWQGTLKRIMKRAQDVPDMQVQCMLSKTLEVFDVLFKVEDVQDHIFELIEEVTHHGAEAIDNMDEHIKAILQRQQQLLDAHPKYATKIEESIGYSLALLRQRYTFSWPKEHDYFY